MAVNNRFQFLRGLDANRSTITPKAGEPLYTTDAQQLFVGDGTTAGGNPVVSGNVKTGTPASASATGTVGMIFWDASYIYICIAANTWKRVAISTW